VTEFSMQKINQGNSPGPATIAIGGEMTILNAAEIRTNIMEVISGGNDLHLDLKGVTDVDLTGLQLICAAHISAIKLRKRLDVDFSLNEPLKKIIHDAGFLRHIGCSIDISNTCVWTGGECQ